MISFSLFLWYLIAISGDPSGLFLSMIIGTILLAVGMVLYKKGQWGEADAWILASIGYALPLAGGLFIYDYIFNFFIVSAAYMIAYTLVLGVIKRGLFAHFTDELRNYGNAVLLSIAGLSAFVIALSAAAGRSFLFLIPVIAFFALFLVYAKTIEKYAFRKRIHASKLKPGDVLEDMVWRGITEKEVKKIARQKQYVIVKEGVRFVLAFPIALIVTLLYGNLFFMFFV